VYRDGNCDEVSAGQRGTDSYVVTGGIRELGTK